MLAFVGPIEGQVQPAVTDHSSIGDLIRNMKSLVIQISYHADVPVPNAQGIPPNAIAGSGFLVGLEGYAVTAAHVITETEKVLQQSGAKKVDFGCGVSLDTQSVPGMLLQGSFVVTGCVVVDVDTSHDVAILRLAQNPFSPRMGTGVNGANLRIRAVAGTKLQTELPSEGEEVLVSGYPLPSESPTLVTQRGMVASLSFEDVQAPAPSPSAPLRIPDIADIILVDLSVNPGNSGGPFYMSGTGNIVGICHGYLPSPVVWSPGQAPVFRAIGGSLQELTQNSGLAVVEPIKYAVALLAKNKIAY